MAPTSPSLPSTVTLHALNSVTGRSRAWQPYTAPPSRSRSRRPHATIRSRATSRSCGWPRTFPPLRRASCRRCASTPAARTGSTSTAATSVFCRRAGFPAGAGQQPGPADLGHRPVGLAWLRAGEQRLPAAGAERQPDRDRSPLGHPGQLEQRDRPRLAGRRRRLGERPCRPGHDPAGPARARAASRPAGPGRDHRRGHRALADRRRPRLRGLAVAAPGDRPQPGRSRASAGRDAQRLGRRRLAAAQHAERQRRRRQPRGPADGHVVAAAGPGRVPACRGRAADRPDRQNFNSISPDGIRDGTGTVSWPAGRWTCRRICVRCSSARSPVASLAPTAAAARCVAAGRCWTVTTPPSCDQIVPTSAGAITAPPQPFDNRGTFYQAVAVNGHR